jgi:hypothetical protein
MRGGSSSGPHVEGGWTCVWPDENRCGVPVGTHSEHFSYLPNAISGQLNFNPGVATTVDLIGLSSPGHSLDSTASKYLTLGIAWARFEVCAYNTGDYYWGNVTRFRQSPGECNITYMHNGSNHEQITIPDITIRAEVYGEAISPHEIETSILIRSPNEHGNVDRSIGSPLTLGNRTNTWNDKRLRDSYTISTVVRNLFYASQ